MTDWDRIEQRVEMQLSSRAGSDTGLVSVTITLQEMSALMLPVLGCWRYFWARPSQEQRWLGLGVAWQRKCQGPGMLSRLAESAQQLRGRHSHIVVGENCATPRMAVLGYGKGAAIYLPQIQLQQQHGHCWLTVTPDPRQPDHWRVLLRQLWTALAVSPEPLSGPPILWLEQELPQLSEWLQLGTLALTTMKAAQLDKLVLSRRVTYRAHRPLSPVHLLQTLMCQQPGCTIFAADLDQSCWLGASPERLLDLQGQYFQSEAVAGTVRRDPYPQVDKALGRWLLGDAKNRHEHQLVVEALRQGLSLFSQQMEITKEPALLRLRGLQHLHTPIRGELHAPYQPLHIADSLHPSPAVCGWPKMEAQRWLKLHEPLDRSLYTGLTGWIDMDGNAALNVVLRCAELQGQLVNLYAGAGLVPESDPMAEWEETALKLTNMIQALEAA